MKQYMVGRGSVILALVCFFVFPAGVFFMLKAKEISRLRATISLLTFILVLLSIVFNLEEVVAIVASENPYKSFFWVFGLASVLSSQLIIFYIDNLLSGDRFEYRKLRIASFNFIYFCFCYAVVYTNYSINVGIKSFDLDSILSFFTVFYLALFCVGNSLSFLDIRNHVISNPK